MSTFIEIRPDEVDQQFEVIAPLLAPVITGAAKGEFTLEDLKEYGKSGAALLWYIVDAGIPVLAGAFEIINYPRLRVLNIMAVGGSGLRNAAAEHFKMVRAFARFIQADEIRAYCSAAMARKLRRDIGFETIYHVVSIPVEEQ